MPLPCCRKWRADVESGSDVVVVSSQNWLPIAGVAFADLTRSRITPAAYASHPSSTPTPESFPDSCLNTISAASTSAPAPWLPPSRLASSHTPHVQPLWKQSSQERGKQGGARLPSKLRRAAQSSARVPGRRCSQTQRLKTDCTIESCTTIGSVMRC